MGKLFPAQLWFEFHLILLNTIYVQGLHYNFASKMFPSCSAVAPIVNILSYIRDLPVQRWSRAIYIAGWASSLETFMGAVSSLYRTWLWEEAGGSHLSL